jgi:hypothetical protein
MQQLSLSLEPGLAVRFRDIRECFASCVYKHGLGRVASAIDVAPSNLSTMLSGERNLDPSLIEKYMVEFKDVTPALYWAARHLQDSATLRHQAISAIPDLVAQLQRLVKESE